MRTSKCPSGEFALLVPEQLKEASLRLAPLVREFQCSSFIDSLHIFLIHKGQLAFQ